MATKKKFDNAVAQAFRNVMKAYNDAPMANEVFVSSHTASGSGGFIDPDTGQRLAYKITIGAVGFDDESVDDNEDEAA